MISYDVVNPLIEWLAYKMNNNGDKLILSLFHKINNLGIILNSIYLSVSNMHIIYWILNLHIILLILISMFIFPCFYFYMCYEWINMSFIYEIYHTITLFYYIMLFEWHLSVIMQYNCNMFTLTICESVVLNSINSDKRLSPIRSHFTSW